MEGSRYRSRSYSPNTPASAARSASWCTIRRECAAPMRFAVYEPPQARRGPVPVLYYLAGLTCTEETFMIKAGAQRLAAEHGHHAGRARHEPARLRLPGDDASWDFGLAARVLRRRDAGAMVGALPHVQLRDARTAGGLVAANSRADPARQSIFGHSMGGHGALVCALRNPAQYRSVSAFAPISAPMRCPWGRRRSRGYLGRGCGRLAGLRRQRARRPHNRSTARS